MINREFTKSISRLFLIHLSVILVFSTACEAPATTFGADGLKVDTEPHLIMKEVATAELCYGIWDSREQDFTSVFLSNNQGLNTIRATNAFLKEFKPQRLVAGKHLFSFEHDPRHYLTKMVIVNRDVFKRTAIEYNHILPVAGEPVLSDSAILIAMGMRGKPGTKQSYLGILSLTKREIRKARLDIEDDELSKGATIPLLWIDDKIHSLFISDLRLATYFIADEKGIIESSMEIPEVYIERDVAPTGWHFTDERGDWVLIAIKGSVIKVNLDSMTWDHQEIDRFARVLGIFPDGDHFLWITDAPDSNSALLKKRKIQSGRDETLYEFGDDRTRNLLESSLYSARNDCVFFDQGDDIWRIDLSTGIYGRVLETDGIDEEVIWVW